MVKKPIQYFFCALLIIGLLCALLLCGIRSGMELKNSRVSLVMTEEAAARLGGFPEGICAFDGAPIQGDALVLVEDDNQYSYVPDAATDAAVKDRLRGESGSFVRCFHLTEKYAARYNYLGYAGAEEIENILYRAATDRNIRLLWLEPFTDAGTGETVTDASVYTAVANSLAHRLQRQGLTLGAEYSSLAPYAPNEWLLALTAICAVVTAGILLLRVGFGLRDKASLFLFILGCIACGGLLAAKQDFAVMFLAFASAFIFPCLAVTWTERRLEKAQNDTLGKELGFCSATLLVGFLIVLAGGIVVGALQSFAEWMLSIRNFRGVKLSFVLPLLYAAYIVLRRLCTVKEILQGRKFLLLLALLVFAAAVVFFLLRTGNEVIYGTPIEQRLRNLMECRLLVRPRGKEFLIGWPCLGLACGLCARGGKRWSWPFAILTAIGYSSVVNTFCHSRASVWLSVVRSIYGLIAGLALALVFSALLHRRKTDEKTCD